MLDVLVVHSWVIDIEATALDVWEDRFNSPNSNIADNNQDAHKDGLTNKQEFELVPSDDVRPRLADFWIENLIGEVELHFNQRPQYQQMRVYRRTGAVGSFTFLGTFDPSGGEITDSGLLNDQDYCYFLQPLGASGVTGAPTRGCSSRARCWTDLMCRSHLG